MNSRTKKKNSQPHVSEKIIQIGTYFKKTSQDFLILGKYLPNLGEKVYDKRLRWVGYVSNVFGRVENFFIMIRNLANMEFQEGDEFYIISREKKDSQKKIKYF